MFFPETLEVLWLNQHLSSAIKACLNAAKSVIRLTFSTHKQVSAAVANRWPKHWLHFELTRKAHLFPNVSGAQLPVS
ncbi:MAG: hypothetical protein K1Y36_07360 [Blastocatellia bacterium]|nr:hypothetical protein [Blastocatellia bacterium]